MGLIMNNLMLDLDWNSPPEKIYGFSKDPLALSWACYRQSQEKSGSDPFPDLHHVVPIEHDFAMADQSRSYYRDSIVFRQLQGGTVSKFTTDLYRLLTDQAVTSKNIGMLYKIPYFYQEDTAKAELKKFFTPIRSPNLGKVVGAIDLSLTFHSKIHRFRKNENAMEFWFYNDAREPFMTSVVKTNPLSRLFESVCKQPKLDIKALVYCKPKHYNIDFDFYQLTQIELR